MRSQGKAGKGISFLLAMLLLFGTMPAYAWAASGSSGECRFAAYDGSDGNNVIETAEIVGGGGSYTANIKLNLGNVTNDVHIQAWIMDQRQYYTLIEQMGGFLMIDYGSMDIDPNGGQSIDDEPETVIAEIQSPQQYSTASGQTTICALQFNLTNYAIMADTGDSSPYYIIAKGDAGVVGIESARFFISKDGTPVEARGDAEVSITKPAADSVTSGASVDIEATVTPSAVTATGDVSKMAYQLSFHDGSTTRYLDGTGGWTTTEGWIEDTVAYTTAGGAQTWTTTAALSNDGAYTLKVKAQDGVGWGSVDSVSFKKDATGPKVSKIERNAGAAELTSGTAVSFKVTYDEGVTKAAVGDFAATAGGVTGTVNSVTADGSADANGCYQAWIVSVDTSSAADGDVVIGPKANQTAMDAAGNKLTDTTVAGSKENYVLDKTAPSVTGIQVGGVSITSSAVGVTGVAISGTMKLTLSDAHLKKSGTIDKSGLALTTGGIGSSSISAVRYAADGSVEIDFAGLQTETSYQLTIPANTLEDALGNKLANQVQSCVFQTTNGVPNTVTWNNPGVSGGVNKTYGDADFTEAATALSTAGGPVRYSSSNTSVAAVDANGKVEIKGAGTAVITAASADGGADAHGTPYISATATYDLTVTKKALSTSGWTFEKGYDATTAAALADMKGGSLNRIGSTVFIRTGVGSEEIVLSSVTAAFRTANVEAGQTVSVTAITLADNPTTGALAANYVVVGKDTVNVPAVGNELILKGTITQKTLTWKTTSAAAATLNKVYDADRTATVPTGGLTFSAVTYFDGIAGPDQGTLEMKLLAGPYTNAFADANVGSHLVTIPKSGIELYLGGSHSDNYILPDSGTALSAEITKADVSFGTAYTAKKGSMNAGSAPFAPIAKTSPGGVAVTGLSVDLNGANALDAVNVLYEVKIPAVTTDGAVYTYSTDGGITTTTVSIKNSEKDTYVFLSPAGVSVASGASLWITPAGMGTAYKVIGQPTATQIEVTGATTAWENWDQAYSYVNGLAVNATVNLKLFLAGGGTNLNAVASPAATSAVLTIQSSGSSTDRPSGGGGGGSVSTYTVTYDPGDHGKVEKTTESVANGNSPKGVKVTADEGWVFAGWSKDGKTVIDLKDVKVTGAMKLIAVYEKDDKIVIPDSVPEDLRFLQVSKGEISGGYVSGYTDGTFRPDNAITRAEVAAIVAKTINYEKEEDKSYTNTPFSDVARSEWYADDIGFVASLGVIAGYKDGTFKPNSNITRAEFVTMAMKIDRVVNSIKSFKDMSDADWYAEYVKSAAEKGYATGYLDGTFRPNNPITRAEAVTIINAIIGLDPASGQISFSDVAESHWAYSNIKAAAEK